MSEHTIPARRDIAAKDTWDLSVMFESTEKWQEEYDQLMHETERYEPFRGRLSETADIFFDLLELDLSLSRRLEKVFVYAHLLNDQDKTDSGGEMLFQKAVALSTRASEASSFIVPEIQALPLETVDSYKASPRAAGYDFYLEKILRYRPHTLSQEVEHVLAMASESLSAPYRIFSQLDNADFTFGTVTNSKGETRELSHGNFNTFLMDRDRTVRQTAFFQYYGVYDSHRYSLAAALASSMKKDWLHARIRNHASCRSASLFSDNVDVSVYDNLVAATRANIGGMSAYMELRRLVLDLDSLHFYDTYVPMVDTVDISIPYEEAVEICLEALSPLGSEYTGILREGLLGGWVDRYENRGKRSGAYSSGCYDSYPYILLNYDSSNINSLYTLIHEAGHSMHSYYSVQNQPYHYHDYTIFVAEVASTFNETLLSDHLMKRYSHDPLMKKYIINRELENLRGTLFRQTMFAEFEHVMHSLVETDTPVTVETLRHEYRKLLDFYFNGSIVIDDVLELECLRIPQFYSAFYVYKYATGIAAAISLAERVIAGETPALDNYLKFLSLGGSMFPLDELKTAGVDMTTPGPVEKALARFSTLIEDFTSLM